MIVRGVPANCRQNHHARLSRLPSKASLAEGRGYRVARSGLVHMRLSQEEVVYVARLARLGMSDEEVARMQDQLSSILEHVAALNELDTDAIPPTAQVISLTNVMRQDTVTGSLSRDAVLANAPRQTDGFFEVQTILGAADEDPGQ